MRSTYKMIAILTLLVTAPLLISTISANAQSVSNSSLPDSLDCTKASKSAEFAICNNEELLVMHEKLAEIYSSKVSNLTTKPQIQLIATQQFDWMKARNDCQQNSMCLKFLYRERIRTLTSLNS